MLLLRYAQAQWEQNGVRGNISEKNSLQGWAEVARCRMGGALGAEEMQVGRQGSARYPKGLGTTKGQSSGLATEKHTQGGDMLAKMEPGRAGRSPAARIVHIELLIDGTCKRDATASPFPLPVLLHHQFCQAHAHTLVISAPSATRFSATF